jgi:hypothetical protein
MNLNPSYGRPLDDIDVRVEETEASLDADRRVEFATFTEGEYVESILVDRNRAREIYRNLGALLGEFRKAEPAAHKPSTTREVPVCPHCGSDNVVADAAARWYAEGQIWEVSNVFDKGHGCDDCGAGEIAFDWISEEEHKERTSAP